MAAPEEAGRVVDPGRDGGYAAGGMFWLSRNTLSGS